MSKKALHKTINAINECIHVLPKNTAKRALITNF